MNLKDTEMEKVLLLFTKHLQCIFKDKLYSILIYGSVVLNDFRLGKGDIDFLVVLKENISELEIKKIVQLHEDLRNDKLGLLGKQLEGSYYTIQMFNSKSDNDQGYYVGTSRNGWKKISKVNLNSYDRKNIIMDGVILYGVNIAHLIEDPSMTKLKSEFMSELANRIEYMKKNRDTMFLIDTVYLTLRGISLFEKERVVSKSDAVKGYLERIQDENDVQLIEYISQFRYPLVDRVDEKYIALHSINWINRMYQKYESKGSENDAM